MTKRVYSNPCIRDVVTFIETAAESEGRQTLVELVLAPGGGVFMHRHRKFDEEFTAIEGELGLKIADRTMYLQPGEMATASMGTYHRFFNPGTESIRFRVRLSPGHAGFEQAIQISYGLAGDGQINKKGIPKKISHMVLLCEMSDTNLPGILAVPGMVLHRRARRAVRSGIDRKLIARYAG